MKSTYQYLLAACGLGLLSAVAACSRDLTGSAGAVPTSVALHSVAAPAAAAPASAGPLADGGDRDGHGMPGFGRIRKADIDSLTVDVAKVEVLAANPDSENAADSAAETMADSGKHEDQERGDDHENDERTWISLDVTAGGHLNLLKLPDSASGGLTIATGTLAPGPYKHVRLFVTNPVIFLKTQIVTPTGDTLKAGVGIPVIIPSADSTGAAIKTDERFVVPSGGGTVQLYFDADDTIRHVVVTGDGKIIVPPVIH
jgi:hypothetical protein